jgi:hypothetical protein
MQFSEVLHVMSYVNFKSANLLVGHHVEAVITWWPSLYGEFRYSLNQSIRTVDRSNEDRPDNPGPNNLLH